MRNGYIMHTLISVDNQEIVKTGGRVVQIYEGVIYKQNFRISPFRKIIEKLIASGQNYKNEDNHLMKGLVKVLKKSLYGVQKCKEYNEFYKCKSEHWMRTENDENVIDYWRLPNGN